MQLMRNDTIILICLLGQENFRFHFFKNRLFRILTGYIQPGQKRFDLPLGIGAEAVIITAVIGGTMAMPDSYSVYHLRCGTFP